MKPFNSLGVLGKVGDRVFQRVRPGLGNVAGDPTHSLQNRAYVPHNTSHTPAQLACRARFAAAVAAWHALSTEQQSSYTERAKSRAIAGFNLFVSEYLRSI